MYPSVALWRLASNSVLFEKSEEGKILGLGGLFLWVPPYHTLQHATHNALADGASAPVGGTRSVREQPEGRGREYTPSTRLPHSRRLRRPVGCTVPSAAAPGQRLRRAAAVGTWIGSGWWAASRRGLPTVSVAAAARIHAALGRCACRRRLQCRLWHADAAGWWCLPGVRARRHLHVW